MGMTEATIVQWYRSEGEEIIEGEPLVEVESSKANEVIEAPASGVISKILHRTGEDVGIGQVLAIIIGPDEVGTLPPIEPSPRPERREALGPEGEQLPLTAIRRRTAKRMVESLQGTAQLTLHSEVDVTLTVQKRERIKADTGVTYTDIFVEIVAAALEEHPVLNARWSEEAILIPGHINIGVAVDLGEGLVVPVLRDANHMSLVQIHTGLQRLVERARSGNATIEELSEGTFTITNLGRYCVDTFTPILNPPETAILGIGRIIEKPAVVDGDIVPRAMMGLSLTFDHRVVDGATASAFLDQVRLALEEARF
jgi:pyruvate dehydrogenase E2 component (dihydrolipoamide acetyltransferase)